MSALLQRIRTQRAAMTLPQQKAISHHPELEGRTHVSSSLAGSADTALEAFADYAQVYSVYPWVYKAVSLIANNIAGLPVAVVDEDGETQEGHPLAELFERVNDTYNAADLWSMGVVHKFLGGEEFIQIVPDGRGRPAELWSRRPDWVSLYPDMSRGRYPSVAQYSYDPKDGEPPLVLPPEQVIHDRFYNPLSPWRGLAPISAVREGITIDLFAQSWSKRFMRNSARPDFAIVAPQGITQSERDRYLGEFMRDHQGADKAHLPVILEEGVTDIKTFSFAPKDIEWLEQRKFSRDEVGAVFGVPDEMMGYGRDTYENFQTALEVFWTLTLSSLLMRRDVLLTTFFQRHYPALLRVGERIETDTSDVSVLQEDTGPKVDIAVKLWRMGVPFNVLDERLGLGIGEVEGGAVAYVETSVAPVGQAVIAPGGDSPMPMERSAEWRIEENQLRNWLRKHRGESLDAFVARYLTADAKREIAQEVAGDAGFFPETMTLWDGKVIPSGAASVKAMLLQLDPDDPEAEREARMEIERRAERRIGRALARQQDGVINSITGLTPERYLQWEMEELEAVLARSREEFDLYDELRRMLLQGVDLGVSVAVQQLGTIGFDWTLANEDARRWADQHTGELITGVNDTTWRRVRDATSEWIRNGEPLDMLIEDLELVFGRRRAELIASTEVTAAFYRGNIEAYRVSGVVEETSWQTVRDEKCKICGPLHGKRARLGESFEGGYEPPVHPRCRCWIVPVVPTAEELAVSQTQLEASTTPSGPNVSAALKGPSRGINKPLFDDVVSTIDSVHGDGQLPDLPVKFVSSLKDSGQYRSYARSGKPLDIKVNSKTSSQYNTLTHEIGHFLDHKGSNTAWMSKNAPEFEEWRKAAKNSQAVQTLAKKLADPEAYRQTVELPSGRTIQMMPTRDVLQYFLRTDEIWARSYAQYIAEKSGNSSMLRDLQDGLEDKLYGEQSWTTEDFAPISAAIDSIFRGLGWLR